MTILEDDLMMESLGNDDILENHCKCDSCTNDEASVDGEIINIDIYIAEITDVSNHLPNSNCPGVDSIIYEMTKIGS